MVFRLERGEVRDAGGNGGKRGVMICKGEMRAEEGLIAGERQHV